MNDVISSSLERRPPNAYAVFLILSGRMFGGGQRVVADLAAVSSECGASLDIILLGCETDHFNRFTPVVVPYNGHYNRLFTLLGTAIRLRWAMRRSTVDLIHTHGWDADLIGWLAGLGLRRKQLMHLHVTPDWLVAGSSKQRARRWLTKLAIGDSKTHLVGVSAAVKEHWTRGLRLQDERIRVVRNGIDIERYVPIPQQGSASVPVVGVAARLAPMKGIEYLIDALGLLAQDGVTFNFRVAGTGSLRDDLESRCGRVGIGRQTEFLGHVVDMPDFYRTIDLYALPSVSTEGLPLSVLEAMACGLPVVATTVAGTPEAVRNGIDGLLVPPRDVRALAEALGRLLGDADARRAMGRAGRARAVESFSLERFSGEILQLYREIVGERTV